MDTAKASLVLLMHRYLGGLMDPFVTLLEMSTASGTCCLLRRG